MNDFQRYYLLAKEAYAPIKYRRVVVPVVTELITSEAADVHWPYLAVDGKTTLDLGCGLWDSGIENSSPVYFKRKGAKRIIGVDMNKDDIHRFREYFEKNYQGDRSEFMVKEITKRNDVIELLDKYMVESIKCDIEGYEGLFCSLTRFHMKLISDFAVEYHNRILMLSMLDAFERWGFKKIKHCLFDHASPNMGVLFASR